MKMTTLCYIENMNQYLMMYRNKKKDDENENKWIGIGGKFNKDETPTECMRREVYEETGLTVLKYNYLGIITFISNQYQTEYMHLFKVTHFKGELIKSDEGELKWLDKDKLGDYPMWKGDIIFLKLISLNIPFFSLKLKYENEHLTEASLNEEILNLEVWLK